MLSSLSSFLLLSAIKDSSMGDLTSVTATEAVAVTATATIITTTAGVAARPPTSVPIPITMPGDMVIRDNILDPVQDVYALLERVEGVVVAADNKDQGALLENLEGVLVSTSTFCFYFVKN